MYLFKASSSTVSSTLVEVVQPWPNLILEHFQPPKETLVPIHSSVTCYVSLPPHPKPWQPLICLASLWIRLCWILQVSGPHNVQSFGRVPFTELNVFRAHPCSTLYQYWMLSCSWMLLLCMDRSRCIYPFIYRQAYSLFLFGGVTNNATVNTHAQGFA